MAECVVSVTTTGGAGAATGTADTPPIWGDILSININYHASAPATTTVDIDEVGGAARKILDKAASNTDVTHTPRERQQDNTGTNITGYERFTIDGRVLRVSLALSDALVGAAVVTFYIDGRVGVS